MNTHQQHIAIPSANWITGLGVITAIIVIIIIIITVITSNGG